MVAPGGEAVKPPLQGGLRQQLPILEGFIAVKPDLLAVSLLLSFVPVGFTAVAAATLISLDEDLANALWFSATLLVLPVLPLLKPLLW